MYYRHPRIGLAFELPDDWELDRASTSAEGGMVVLRLGATRLLLQVRRSPGNAAVRLHAMQAHLASAHATRIVPCHAPPFGQSRDIVALSYFIAKRQQRWISIVQDGYDYTLSHTDDWQDVASAIDRLAASFVFPASAQIDHALRHASAPAEASRPFESGPIGDTRAAMDARHREPAVEDPWRHPDITATTAAARLWHRVSERLRRVARPQE